MTDLPSRRLAQAGNRAQELAKLVEHPSWAVLRAELDRVEGDYIANLARKLTLGGIDTKPVDQRHLDYQRGFFRGARWILDNPDIAERTLKREIERMDG